MRSWGRTTPRGLFPATGVRVVLATALCALVIPAGVWATTGSAERPGPEARTAPSSDLSALATEANGNIPGVPLPPSPVAGKLDDTAGIDDWDDVYSVDLTYNQKLNVSMTGDEGTDFDLWLWKPGSTSVHDSNPEPHIANSSQTKGTSTESLWYPVMSGGTYYLDVFSDPGTSPNKGAYTLTWSIEQMIAPTLSMTANHAVVRYNGSATLSGVASLSGTPLASNPILVQKRLAGSDSSWTSLNYGSDGTPKTRTDAAGRFTYAVSGITRKMEYRAVVWPSATHGWRHGAPVAVKPHAYLSRPYAPRTVYRNRSFWVYGFLKTRHGAGARSVTITAYRSGMGAWRYARNYNYSSYTKYGTSMQLPYAGRWKLVATTPADGYHAATTSSATYVTVR